MRRNLRSKRKLSPQAQISQAADWRRLHLPRRPKRILLDHEQRAFVDWLLPHKTFTQIAAACCEKFGTERALGRSAIHRYWLAVVRPQTELPVKRTGVKRAIKKNLPAGARGYLMSTGAPGDGPAATGRTRLKGRG